MSLSLSVGDFQDSGKSRIDFSSFTNIEKAVTQTQFDVLKASGNYEIYHKEGIARYLNEALKKMDETIEKAGDMSKEDILKSIKNDLTSIEVLNVLGHDGKMSKAYVRRKSDDEIKKALDSIAYSQNFKMKKTGKEIKEKLKGIMTRIEAKKEEAKKALEALDEDMTEKPTEKVGSWDDPDDCCGYKLFMWNKTRFNDGEKSSYYSDNSGVNVTAASTEDEAKKCRKWNELVYTVCRCMSDYEKARILSENLEDKKSFELSTKELQELGF